MRIGAATLPLPRHVRLDVARFAPSAASLGFAFLLFAIGIASYGAARKTSLFAIQRVEVIGGSPDVRGRVAAALSTLEGESLVGLSRSDVDAPLAAVPDVAGATYDRAFPHTLRVFVLAERPLAVVRHGADAWLVSARGRILRRLRRETAPRLPRLWIRRSVAVAAGGTLTDPTALRGVRVLEAATRELEGVSTVRFDGDDASVVLRGGVEVRLGSEHDLRLKLAVAASVLPQLLPTERYIDVAVPSRPVTGSSTSS